MRCFIRECAKRFSGQRPAASGQRPALILRLFLLLTLASGAVVIASFGLANRFRLNANAEGAASDKANETDAVSVAP